MIDLHSHVLAGIDDGAASLADSVALIHNALENGVTQVLATPHIHFGVYDNDITTIATAFAALTAQLQQTERLAVDFCLAYAAEVRICPEIMILAKQNKLPFMGKWHGMDLLLLEFPSSQIPLGSEKLVDWLIQHNIKPMIAHPERNRDLWQFSELLRPFVRRGCLLQVTAGSLVGDFGERAEMLAWQLLKQNDVSVIASDMHSVSRRPCKMQQAYHAVESRCGADIAQQLFVNNPKQIFASNPTRWTAQ